MPRVKPVWYRTVQLSMDEDSQGTLVLVQMGSMGQSSKKLLVSEFSNEGQDGWSHLSLGGVDVRNMTLVHRTGYFLIYEVGVQSPSL